MARKAKMKADHRADARGGAWAGLPHCVLDSPAYRHLGLCARTVLVELIREMNGYNNGEIVLSQRQIAERLNMTNFRSIGRAVAELMEHGLIDVAAEGQWKQRLARQYRLTFVSTGGPGNYRPATNEYRDWRFSGADDVSAEKAVPADNVSAGPRNAADDVSARIAAHRRKTAISQNQPADDVSSLISKPYPGTKTDEGKTPSNEPEITGGRFSARAAA